MLALGHCGIDIGLIAVVGCCAVKVLVFVILHAIYTLYGLVGMTW